MWQIVQYFFQDIVGAGGETTATALEWAMTELIRNPRVPEKAQAEVRNVLGGKVKIDEVDSKKLRYLKCVIKETLRLRRAPFRSLVSERIKGEMPNSRIWHSLQSKDSKSELILVLSQNSDFFGGFPRVANLSFNYVFWSGVLCILKWWISLNLRVVIISVSSSLLNFPLHLSTYPAQFIYFPLISFRYQILSLCLGPVLPTCK